MTFYSEDQSSGGRVRAEGYLRAPILWVRTHRERSVINHDAAILDHRNARCTQPGRRGTMVYPKLHPHGFRSRRHSENFIHVLGDVLCGSKNVDEVHRKARGRNGVEITISSFTQDFFPTWDLRG